VPRIGVFAPGVSKAYYYIHKNLRKKFIARNHALMQARMGVPTHIIPQKPPPHKAMREQSAGRGQEKKSRARRLF